VAVGEVEIEEDKGRRLYRQCFQSVGQTRNAGYVDWAFAFDQPQPDQVCVAGIVFD
jgi:hypothetical protein